MKKIILLLSISCPILSISQDTSHSKNTHRAFYYSISAYGFTVDKEYDYSINNNMEPRTINFLHNPSFSFGLNASVNYFLDPLISIGIEGGFQRESIPGFSSLQLGGIVRYFIENTSMNIFISGANNFSLNKNKFRSGDNYRVGFTFVSARFSNNKPIYMSIFYQKSRYDLKNTEPLLGLQGEIPDFLTGNSIGISIEFRL